MIIPEKWFDTIYHCPVWGDWVVRIADKTGKGYFALDIDAMPKDRYCAVESNGEQDFMLGFQLACRINEHISEAWNNNGFLPLKIEQELEK